MTVDVEDYFQVTALDALVDRDDWPNIPSRVQRNTQKVLQLFERAGVRATFFVLGWVAERFPQIVRDIDQARHEIASHSYWHRQIYRQTPDEFRADLRRSRAVLEDLTGKPVTQYRAPTFSITRQSLWALDILAEEEIMLDASIFPIRHDRYGIPDAPLHIHRRPTTHGELWEFPPTVVTLAGQRVPLGGGGYFRLLPYAATRALWRKAEVQHAPSPLMFYFHPWEIDPEQPRIPGMRRMNAFRHRLNLHSMQQKLERLLSDFRFGTVSDALTTALPATQPAVEALV